MKATNKSAISFGAIALALVVIAANYLLGGGSRADATTKPPAAPPAAVQAGGPAFRSERSLEQHFEKHGHEFGAATAAEYLELAQRLRDRPLGSTVLEATRRDGVTTRFDRESGAFVAFNSDRTIRTLFVPNDGEAYFRRQAARDD